MAGLKVIVPPAVEPVTPAEVLQQLRLEPDDESLDPNLVIAAREWCEDHQNRAYITQTLELALDRWPCSCEIEIPRPKLQSVTSLIYTDKDGAATTWAPSNYSVDDYSFVGRLVKAHGVSWPSVCLAVVNGVKVRYIAGYGDTADTVPTKIKQAITILTMHWYEHGMCDPPPAVLSLLSQDRVVPV